MAGKDHAGDDLDPKSVSGNIYNIAAACSLRIDCRGFNRGGLLKRQVEPVQDSPLECTYVKQDMGSPLSCLSGIDIQGTNLNTGTYTANMTACRNLCFNDTRCVLATRTTSGLCYLRSAPFTSAENGRNGVDAGVESTCWIRANRGTHYCTADWEVSGVHVAGSNPAVVAICGNTKTDLVGCSDRCNQAPDCQFYVHYDDRRCMLMKDAMRADNVLPRPSNVCGRTAANNTANFVCFRVQWP